MAKIGFIGMGNMGTAILEGLLKERRPEDMPHIRKRWRR